jgi:hypothetical protein
VIEKSLMKIKFVRTHGSLSQLQDRASRVNHGSGLEGWEGLSVEKAP